MIFPKDKFIERLKFGHVVRFSHPKFPEKEHFFVIVDNSPNKIPPMISLISSKSCSNKRSYVVVEEHEYDFFTMQSFIDCDQVYDVTPDGLYELYKESRLSIQGTLLQPTLEKIKDTCWKSVGLEKSYKKRIVNAYNKVFNIN
ncbi:MAG: hypothetical protein AB7E96_08545 [Deferribacterales bacterium]